MRHAADTSDIATGQLAIVPEAALVLRSRDFLRGDVVKRSLTNVESATIVDITSEVKLEHAITRELIDDWVPYGLLRNSMTIEARDKVVYDNWIGSVEEVSADGRVWRCA